MMHYKVESSKRGKVFETLEEAIAYEADLRKATGIFVAIVETTAKVTHRYPLDDSTAR